MTTRTNELGLPIGVEVPAWTPRPRPALATLAGRYCRLEPLDAARHAAGLHESNALDTEGRMWTYLAYGPFESLEDYRRQLEVWEVATDPLFFAIVDARDSYPEGVGSYLRIEPAAGSIEIGHLQFSPRLQRSAAATEALYLLMRQAFDLGYRRCEWKCDALNAASRRAAERLGFSFEGVFRQALVYKARNRDTAWYSIIDAEWPRLAAEFERWLAPGNFEADGRQRTRLDTRARLDSSRTDVALSQPKEPRAQ
jgi:RimJ/RimL family protein N-acetyltransferase